VHPQRFERPVPAARVRAGADALLTGLLGRPKQLPPIAWPLPYLAAAERVLLAQLVGVRGAPFVGVRGAPFVGVRGAPFVALLGDALGAYRPGDARRLLAELRAPDRRLLLSTDATRDPEQLRRAYERSSASCEARARDALAELAATHAATFDQNAFVYHIRWSSPCCCMELSLTSTRAQLVHVAGVPISFAAGEPLIVARHHKHSTPALHALVALGGWRATRELARGPCRLRLCDPI
jgi:histidine-specific SAM-dependent methyltransferase